MAIQGFFTGDVKIRDLNGVLKAVDGIVEVATDAGTVTSVGLTVGSTGTDVNVANSPITSSGNITLNLPTASATNRGLLSSADWTTFNNKQAAGNYVTLDTYQTITASKTFSVGFNLASVGGTNQPTFFENTNNLHNGSVGSNIFGFNTANNIYFGKGSDNGGVLQWNNSEVRYYTLPNANGTIALVGGAGVGTVTSVAALTLGTSGTDLSSTVANSTTTPVITLNVPTASATNRGALSSADWTTFNSKQGAITLTTTGSSGAATLIGTTLNIPNYSGGLTGYVPYTGATTNVDLGEYEIKAGQFTLDVSPTGTAVVGTTRWNNTIGSSETTLKGGSVILKNGVDLVARVVNKVTPNTTLTKATYPAVRVSGAAGQRLAVSYAQANNDNNSADTIGLVTETIATNQEGFIMTVGQLLDINTTGSLQGETWADGDVLYLSPTTPGALTNVKPTGATGHIVVMGYVEYAHANHGSIYVKIMNGWELDELHNVYISSPVNNQGLFYESATSLWKNKSIATVLGYTPANAATTLTINGTTYDISANRTWNVGTVTSVGTSGPLTGGTITGSGTIGITQATTSTNGYLSSTDWNTFYNKQAAGSYITALTGEATATGPGSATVTLSTSAVTGKLLTGLNLTGGGTIAATDSILQAFGKVQNQISGLAGGVTYQGTWNASTNTPTLTSSVGTKGYYYIVDVAGSTNLNGITDWKIGDWAIFNGSTWDKVDNTDAVSSVNGFTGAVSLTTSNIAEGTNLYYLDSRARLALSFTAGSGAYNNTTGVITIPTNTSQLTNGANFITLSSLSASSPLAYNSGSGAFSIQVANGSQNGYLSSSDWTTFNSKQNAITLTTTGSSGSSTLVGATLNVPTYTLSGLGGVPTTRQLTINGTAYDLSADRSWSVGTHTGSLTSGYIPKATGTTTLADGLMYDTGSAVLIGTATASTAKFMVYSSAGDNHYQAVGTAPSFRFADTITSPTYTGVIGLATGSNQFVTGSVAGDMVLSSNTSSAGNFLFGTAATERMRINATTGNVSIGGTGNTFKLEVTGTTKVSGQLTLGSTITNGTYTYTLPSATGTLALVGGAGVGTVTSIATTGPITGGTITSTGTIGITQANGSTDGYLSSTDWTTFNNKQSALTNPVTGTGTTNYLPKFTGTSTIGNSAIFENGTNVGINTASPSSYTNLTTLTINGTNGSVIDLKTGNTLYGEIYSLTNELRIDAVGASSVLKFLTNSATRMTLDASGNLGLGVTPSAWGSNSFAFQTQGGAVWSFSSAYMDIWQNSYYNGTSSIYQTTAAASFYRQNVGRHEWNTAPSGTAGATISWTQAMTLDASGRLGIGTTTMNQFVNIRSSSTTQSVINIATSDFSRTLNIGVFSSAGYVMMENAASLVLGTSGVAALTIASTGAATFSSSVTTSGGGFVANMGSTNTEGLIIQRANTSSNAIIKFRNNTTDTWILGNRNTGDETFRLYNYNVGADVITISNSGAATFSSSITATQFVANGASTVPNLILNGPSTTWTRYQTSGTDRWDIGNNVGGLSSNQFSFYSNGASSNVFVIQQNGNVGIGTTSPQNLLDLGAASNGNGLTWSNYSNLFSEYSSGALWMSSNFYGNIGSGGYKTSLTATFGAAAIKVSGTSGSGNSGLLQFYVDDATSKTAGASFTPTERMRITSGGNVGINTTSPSYLLDVNGTARFGSAIVASLGTGLVYSSGGTLTSTNPSDQRLKNNIKSLSYGLNEILQLNPKTFYYNDDVNKERLKYGFIAQEVKGIMPELARKLNAETDYLGLETEGIYVTLVNAIKEQQKQIEELKAKIK